MIGNDSTAVTDDCHFPGRHTLEVAQAQLRIAVLDADPQFRLHRTRSRQCGVQAVGVSVCRQPGEIDDADQLPVFGIVDGRGRTGPAVNDFAEVLGPVYLHRVVGYKRSPNRVGARTDFAPQRALDEVHRVGRRGAQLRLAVEPQQQTISITDDDQMLAVRGDWTKPPTNQRPGHLERMRRPPCSHVAAIRKRGRCPRAGGVYPGSLGAVPRFGDRLTHLILVAPAQVLGPHQPKLSRAHRRRRCRIGRGPRIERHNVQLPGSGIPRLLCDFADPAPSNRLSRPWLSPRSPMGPGRQRWLGDRGPAGWSAGYASAGVGSVGGGRKMRPRTVSIAVRAITTSQASTSAM